MKKLAAVSLLAFAVVTALGLGSAVAGIEDKFAGKFLLLKRRPPSSFRSVGSFASFLRKNSIKTVYENEEREWVFESIAFFRRPLGDYEVEVVFYDIGNGRATNQRRFVNSYTQYTQDRNTRSLSGKVRLDRSGFDADKRYMIVASHKGDELAKGEFRTRGTSQEQLDEMKRIRAEQERMKKEMEELARKAKEQQEKQKQKEENKKAAEDLF
jgi:hypothetical protein